MPSEPDGRGQGERMAGAGLLLRRRDDPDVVAEFARDVFQDLEAASVHAVVVGEKDTHACGYERAAALPQPSSLYRLPLAGGGRGRELRHIRNMLAISSRVKCQCLLRVVTIIIAPSWGWPACGISPGKVSHNLPPAAPVARPQPGGGVWGVRSKEARACAGREMMATALVDLYGGNDFEPFDRIILPEGYRPSEKEEFMCGKHRAYFLRKLKAWKEAIVEESRQTMAQLQVDSLREPDLADRASSETDWGIELRTRDRQRKLIAKIDCAIRRLYEGEYGYCEVTGEPISLARLEARPIATMTLEAQERHERIERVSRDA